ncbi:MAG: M61 family peptidase [bacterium]|nr:M61 family peptidase [bacterium]
MRYSISIAEPKEHFVGMFAEIGNPSKEAFQLQLPSWRPGRYELGNFAKNIRKLSITNELGVPVYYGKISKDCWQVDAEGLSKVILQYEYYANQPDAGASFVDAELIYLNPVNCFMYVVGRMFEGFELQLNIPDTWQIACQLPSSNKCIFAKDFDELADSPFFASPNMVHHQFALGESNIHFWFQGGAGPDLVKLEEDTRKYALVQTEIFGELPVKNYHFLYLLLADKFRHGVEHKDSTVIAMGPSTGFAEKTFYNDFLAISSHELFHLWNVKRMRPQEMLPYDFTQENYSRLGYIYEGITTYYGDLMLWRCGVWSFEEYASSLAGDIERHLNNSGRFNYSLAESSFDTWLDGYVPGVKGRKVSIYMEGLLAALVADVEIMVATDCKANLNTVLTKLYQESFKKGRGYSQEMYQAILEEISGISFKSYFSDLIDGCGRWEFYLEKIYDKLGLEVLIVDNEGSAITCSVKRCENTTEMQDKIFEYWFNCTYFEGT